MGFPSYTIATETANGATDLAALMEEIKADTTAIVPDGLTFSDDGLTVVATYRSDPTQAQKNALDSVVGAHGGVAIRPDNARAPMTAVCTQVAITSSSWSTIGGIRMDPDMFVDDIANVRIVATGEAESPGSIRLRLVRGPDASETVLSDELSVADTFGDYDGFSFESNVSLGAGLETYKLQAKRQGPGDGGLRYSVLCFVEAP